MQTPTAEDAMVLPVEKLEAALLELSIEDRAYLAHRLLESLHADGDFNPVDVESAWSEEIRRRLEAVDNGTVDTLPGDKVFAELLAKYGG
jgi:putative addiction module component (TIGR02574 family)